MLRSRSSPRPSGLASPNSTSYAGVSDGANTLVFARCSSTNNLPTLAASGCTVLRGSGATGAGTRELVVALLRTLDDVDREAAARAEAEARRDEAASS